MNKIEFEEILKYVGVTSPSYRIKMQNGKKTPVYNFNGMKVFYYKDDAVVQGRIPLEVATLTKDQLREIAETKLPDLNAYTVEEAMKIIEGTARNMGITIKD